MEYLYSLATCIYISIDHYYNCVGIFIYERGSRERKMRMNSLHHYGKYFLILPLILSFVFITASSGCFENEVAYKVSLEKTEDLERVDTMDRPMRLGVYAMASPKTTMQYYNDFLEYLSEDTGFDFELVQRDNPLEINYLLETGYLDAVIVREDDYFTGHDEFGMEAIAVPIIHGDLKYSSYVIARSDSNIDSLEDFRGKDFAFNSYRFNRGEVVPDYMSSVVTESPDTFFSSYIYSNSQDNFIDMVMQGTLDGAEIDCIMWAYVVENSADYSSDLKIVLVSPPQLVPVIAVHPEADEEERRTLIQSIIDMHKSSEGSAILKQLHFNMFVEMDHDTYESHKNSS